MSKQQIANELKAARNAVNAIDMKAANWEAQWDAKMVRVRELVAALESFNKPTQYTSVDGDIWSVGGSNLRPGTSMPA